MNSVAEADGSKIIQFPNVHAEAVRDQTQRPPRVAQCRIDTGEMPRLEPRYQRGLRILHSDPAQLLAGNIFVLSLVVVIVTAATANAAMAVVAFTIMIIAGGAVIMTN